MLLRFQLQPHWLRFAIPQFREAQEARLQPRLPRALAERCDAAVTYTKSVAWLRPATGGREISSTHRRLQGRCLRSQRWDEAVHRAACRLSPQRGEPHERSAA